MIKIVDTFDLFGEGVSVIARPKYQKLHLQQGDMDGACSIYSLMMYMISLKTLTYRQVTNLRTKFNGQTSKGRLFKEFFQNEGLCRDGFYFSTIAEKLQHSFAKEVSSESKEYDSSLNSQTACIEKIKDSIDINSAIMIAISFKGGSHALLAVGYEERNNSVSKIFCLDPGYGIATYSYWNTVIRLNDNYGKKYSHLSISNNEIKNDVYIQETLLITKK